MDIGSGKGYPSSALSNFAPHPFVVDGVECASMEGFLQSLKFKEPEMQAEVCKLVGRAAKFKGKKKKWWVKGNLYWQGREIDRFGLAYQQILDRAFIELSYNTKFKKALLATNDAVLKHSIGKRKQTDTILTRKEFCGRLTKIRTILMAERSPLNNFIKNVKEQKRE